MKRKNQDWKVMDLGVTLNGIRYLIIKRFAGPFKKFKKELEKSQWYSASQLQALQEEKMRKLIHYAYENVPYYRRVFDEHGIKPNRINHRDDLQKLPILQKEDVRNHYQELVSCKARLAFLYKCHTSGTTGKPLTLFRDLNNIAFEHALLRRQWAWAGLKTNDLYATLKGELVVSSNKRTPPFWRLNRVERKLIMSSYHLSENNAESYIEALLTYKPVGIEGYPSSVFALARLMENHSIEYRMRGVLTSSEILSQEQRDIITKAFQCPVYDYYGMAERVTAIHTCEHGRYHVIPEYGITEFIPKESGFDDGEREIIGTSLTNYAMPLIRYRVGDLARPSEERCPCGRAYPLVDYIVGRKDDYIVTQSGKLIGRLDHIFKGAQNIIESQIVQSSLNEVLLQVVPDVHFGQEDSDYILNNARRRFGDEMNIAIQQVTSIPRVGRGKFRAVVSEINYCY